MSPLGTDAESTTGTATAMRGNHTLVIATIGTRAARTGQRWEGSSVDPVDEVVELFGALGDHHYGEAVDQRRHAVQCALAARAQGAAGTLVAACLLHDIGHLVADVHRAKGTDLWRDDDHHEAVGARWIAPRFGPAVARPVALHVLAKRWRCTVDPQYLDDLSETSRATLMAQGGLLDPETTARFEQSPGFHDAVLLRQWDEAAKDPDGSPGDLVPFLPLLVDLAARPDH